MTVSSSASEVAQLREQIAALEDLVSGHEQTLIDQTARLEAALHQVRLAEQLAEKKLELERTIDELRTTQEELIHASKMAAIGTLVAGLSHELNNPVGVILGFAQTLVKRAAPTEPTRDALIAIETHARRCASLVKALLDFARKQPTVQAAAAIEPLLRGVEALSGGEARRRNIQLSFLPTPESLPEVSLNVTEMESALLNLISNALDASPAGGRVEVSSRIRHNKNQEGVEISVTDTGTGMPPDIVKRIFDPFFTTKGPGRGTGLGLSISRKVIESHGGLIAVHSELGKGTQVTVWLPPRAQPTAPLQPLPPGTSRESLNSRQSVSEGSSS